MGRHLTAARAAAMLGSAADQSPAYQGLADALRLLISDGRIAPGTRLPSERDLTSELEVSRTTVTRAYSLLRERGYLRSRQGSGSVASLPAAAPHGLDSVLWPGAAGATGLDLTCAAPQSPAGVAAAFERAVAELPRYLSGTGYYPSGLPALREKIAHRYAERGLETRPEQVIITSGGLAAIALAARALVAPGDRVLMESPTYPNAIATFRRSGARILGADIGTTGWATAGLTETLTQVRPAAAYLMADFQNPTGLLMAEAERVELARALRRAATVPIVDETLVELSLDEVDLPRPFGAFAKEAITIGSASKAFWGGLRVGWIRAPSHRVGDLITARLSLDLGAPLVEQLALLDLIEHREEVLEVRREQLVTARDALTAALAKELPTWSYEVPAGGLSLWCRLPAARSSALASAAERHGVLLASGPSFAPEGGLEGFLRIPFTQSPADLTGAVGRLAKAWEETGAGRHRRGTDRPLVA